MLLSTISQTQLPILIVLGVLAVALGVWAIVLYAKKTKKVAPKPTQQKAEPKQPFKPEIPQQSTQQKVQLGATAVTSAQPTPMTTRPIADQEETTAKRGVVLVDGNQVLVRYNRSFTAKLMVADEQLKGFYAEIANYTLSFEKVKNKITWSNSAFAFKREKLVVLNVKGKSLYLYLAVDTALAQPLVKQKLKDVSNKKRYAKVPTMVKIRSKRGVKVAKTLIDFVMQQRQIPLAKASNDVLASQFPFDSLQNLIANKLVKVYALDGKKIDENSKLVVAGFRQVHSVTVSQAQSLVTDEVASTLIQEVLHTGSAGGRKFAVNVDTLAENFADGDLVTIEALKKKGIVPNREHAIKVLARGTLDKALVVEADAFSIDAIKMIVVTGGKAIKIKR